MKKNRGITLIALVITIIVMLILVGVSVTVALQGGLFTRAKTAASGTEEERQKELALSNGDIIDQWVNGGVSSVSGNEPKTVYTITWDLEHIKTTNLPTQIQDGEMLEFTLETEDGYYLPHCNDSTRFSIQGNNYVNEIMGYKPGTLEPIYEVGIEPIYSSYYSVGETTFAFNMDTLGVASDINIKVHAVETLPFGAILYPHNALSPAYDVLGYTGETWQELISRYNAMGNVSFYIDNGYVCTADEYYLVHDSNNEKVLSSETITGEGITTSSESGNEIYLLPKE